MLLLIASVLAAAIQLADVITTVIVLSQGGHEDGLVASFLVRLGLPMWAWMAIPKAIFIVLCLAAWYFSGYQALLIVLAGVSAVTLYAVIHNIGQIR